MAPSLHGARMFLRDEGYIGTGRERRGWEGMQSRPRGVGLLQPFQTEIELDKRAKNVIISWLLRRTGSFCQRNPFNRAGSLTMAALAASSLRKWISLHVTQSTFRVKQKKCVSSLVAEIIPKTHGDRRMDGHRSEALVFICIGFCRICVLGESLYVVGGASTCLVCSS